jgi:hypothetical protein
MHGMAYWAGQFLLAAVTMTAILIGMDLISGADWRANAPMSLLWACAAAAIFIVARYTKSGKR